MASGIEDFERLAASLNHDVGDPVPAGSAVELLEAAEGAAGLRAAGDSYAASWRRYLNLTSRTGFLRSLPNREHRYRWAETCFQAILASQYTLADMFEERVRRHPERSYLFEASAAAGPAWTYAQIALRLRTIAAMFCAVEAEPRVAIFSENSIDSACCDLACLIHRIFDTPLSVHFDAATLTWIFDRLAINVVVTDTEDRLLRLLEVRSATARPFRIYSTGAPNPDAQGVRDTESLAAACSRTDLERAGARLERRRNRPITDVATVMFTSGSTGAPKGIAFTLYHLVTKRFARAAALPDVGDDEVLLCYLPLYHTFGRYLELLGMMFWEDLTFLPGTLRLRR